MVVIRGGFLPEPYGMQGTPQIDGLQPYQVHGGLPTNTQVKDKNQDAHGNRKVKPTLKDCHYIYTHAQNRRRETLNYTRNKNEITQYRLPVQP